MNMIFSNKTLWTLQIVKFRFHIIFTQHEILLKKTFPTTKNYKKPFLAHGPYKSYTGSSLLVSALNEHLFFSLTIKTSSNKGSSSTSPFHMPSTIYNLQHPQFHPTKKQSSCQQTLVSNCSSASVRKSINLQQYGWNQRLSY